MALMSAPILVADSTAVSFPFRLQRSAVSIQVRFYTDAEGLAEMGTRGTGTRDVTVTNTSTGYEGPFKAPVVVVPSFVSNIDGGVLAAMVSETWYELDLGSGLGEVTVVAVPNVDAPGSLTYRIIVDAEGL